MPKYMLVYKDEDGVSHASFANTFDTANGNRMDMEVSLGWYVELYERITDEEGLTSYVLIM